MSEQTADTTVPHWLRAAAGWTWRLLVLALAVVVVVWILARLYLVTIPVIVALVLATLCNPPARALERRGVPAGAAAFIVVVGGLASLVGLGVALAPSFVDQVQELRPTIVAGYENILDWLEDGPLHYDRERLAELLDQARARVSGQGGAIVGGVLTGATVVAQFVAALALLIVLLFFFVKDGPQIVDWMQARTPAARRDVVGALGRRSWNALSGYVRGTATIALIDAVGIAIGLALIQVPLVLPLMVLVFLGGFLPVIGAFIAGLVAVLVALAAGGVAKALLTLALIVGVQQLEGNVLQPMIMRRAVALHPVVVLVSLAAGGAIAGIVGAFLAVPIAAVLSAAGNELRLRAELRAAGPSA